MNKNLLRAAAIFGILAGSSGVFAQGPQASFAPGQRPKLILTADQKLSLMTKQLDLTSDQQARFRPILQSEYKKMRAVLADRSLPSDDLMSESISVRREAYRAIKPLLSAAQQEKYEDLVREDSRTNMAW